MALPFLESRRVLYKKSIIYQCFGEPAKVVLQESGVNATFTGRSETVRADSASGKHESKTCIYSAFISAGANQLLHYKAKIPLLESSAQRKRRIQAVRNSSFGEFSDG